MRALVAALLFSFFSPLSFDPVKAFEASGRLNTWTLYITDDFDVSSVLDIYENPGCNNPGQLIERVYGKERAQAAARCDTVCCIERKISGDEIIVERVYESGEEIMRDEQNKIGDTLLLNLGADLQAAHDKWSFKTKGNLTYSALNERALLGRRTYRVRFTEAYAQYEETENDFDFRARLGRQHTMAGALVDGASFNYHFGASGYESSQSLGVFLGLMPHPITKHVDKDFRTAGFTFHYIPEFSNRSATKLLVNAALIGEAYKSDGHRFYFFSRSHFTPFPRLSLFHYSTVDLPAKGDDEGLSSNHFHLGTHFRPNRQWFVGVGFTQFKIDRLLKERIVGYQDEIGQNATAADRLGDTLDRSHRFRVDARLAYKPVPFAQPYLRLRYERRTFDKNKRNLSDLPGTPEDESETENLGLLNKKNSYDLGIGFRSFPLIQLETETSFTFSQRYQSKAYRLYQSATWDNGDFWTVNGYGEVIWSQKSIANSDSRQSSLSVDSADYYLGVGGSLKFLTDFLAHFSYDWAYEDDYSLSRSILVHSLWARLDYRF